MKRLRYAFPVFAFLLYASVAVAQEPMRPPPRDTTLQPDTTETAQDTTQETPVVADTVRPIPQFPKHDLGAANGFSDAVWAWDRDGLLIEGVVTLGDLLERIPGMLTIRSGMYLQPEAASSLGGTGNRLEVWLDGYALDPLLESSFDVSKFELAAIESVRVERRLGNIRVHLETLAPKDNRAFSMVEAATGRPEANLFRGVFLAPKLFFGPLSLAIDRIDTDGLLRAEPADQFSGWVKWSAIRGGMGLQVEYRRTDTERDLDSPWPAQYTRSDLIARARAQLFPGGVAELFGGRSNLTVDTSVSRAESIPRVEEESTQWGAVLNFSSSPLWARGTFRSRDARALPETELQGAGGLRLDRLAATVEASQTKWRETGSATELTARADLGPFGGFRLFGEVTTSDRGVPYLTGLPDSAAVMTSYKGYRAGAAVNVVGITLGGALLQVESDSVTTFGLPFDRTPTLFAGSNVRGGELSGRLPIPLIKGLYAEGSLTQWQSGTRGLYLPERIYRAGIGIHTTPLKSGNLEILARIETIYRGNMLVPNPEGGEEQPLTIEMPPIDLIDGYLQIRIIDVRAFLRYEDMTGQDAPEFPGRELRGPRIFYGVMWQFFN